MKIEKLGTDLVLTISDGELESDPTLLDRAADLALQISGVYCLRVEVSPIEFALHRNLFSSRFSKPPGKNWSLNIRRAIPLDTPDTPRPPRVRPRARAVRRERLTQAARKQKIGPRKKKKIQKVVR